MAVPDDPPTALFFLIIIDYDRSFFCIEGPMTDDHTWQSAARRAREKQRHVVCGPRSPDRDAFAAEFGGTENMAGVPPGSVVMPSQ